MNGALVGERTYQNEEHNINLKRVRIEIPILKRQRFQIIV